VLKLWTANNFTVDLGYCLSCFAMSEMSCLRNRNIFPTFLVNVSFGLFYVNKLLFFQLTTNYYYTCDYCSYTYDFELINCCVMNKLLFLRPCRTVIAFFEVMFLILCSLNTRIQNYSAVNQLYRHRCLFCLLHCKRPVHKCVAWIISHWPSNVNCVRLNSVCLVS